MNEIWKPVVGYEGLYEVSDRGRVRSVSGVTMRSDGKSYTRTGKQLSGATVCGYICYTLCRPDPVAPLRMYKAHRLVAAAFIGQPPNDKPTVNHRNGNKSDNVVCNLEYASASDQQRHRLRVLKKLQPNGEACWCSKNTWGRVAIIRAMWESGEYKQTEIGEVMSLDKRIIWGIVHNKTWQTEEARALRFASP